MTDDFTLEKFTLRIDPRNLIKNCWHTIENKQKLNFEFHFLANHTVLEYLSECQNSNVLDIKNTQTGENISETEKLEWLDRCLDYSFPKINLENQYTLKFYTPIINNLFFYTNLSLLKKYKYYISLFLNPEFTFSFFEDKKFNVLKSALQGEKYEIAWWLVKEYKFSFFENSYDYNLEVILPEQVNFLYKMCEIDSITSHLSYQKGDINKYFSKVKSSIIIKLWIQQIVKDIKNTDEGAQIKLESKSEFLNQVIECYLESENLVLIKYFLSESYFHQNYFGGMTTNKWISYFSAKIYDGYGDYMTNLRKTKLVKIIFQYIQKNTLIWDDFLEQVKETNYNYFSYNNSLLCILVKLPKIIPVLKMIQGYKTLLLDDVFHKFEVFDNLLRYGTLETYHYLEPEMLQFIKGQTEIVRDNYFGLVLANKDIRITQSYYQIYQPLRNYSQEPPDIYFNFLKLPKLREEQKKKRLKFLIGKFNFIKVRKKILDSQVILTFSPDMIYWILSKFYQNTFSPPNISYSEMIQLFQEIINTENKEIIKFVVERIEGFEFKHFFISLLRNLYFWYDDLVQLVLSKCEPLKDLSDTYKRDILTQLTLCFKESVTVPEWVKVVKCLKENNFNLEEVWHTYANPRELYIIKVARSYNTKYLRALIQEGVSIKPIYDFYIYSYYPYFNYTNVNTWAKIFILFRRLIFRKQFKKRKQHQIEFRSTIIDIKCRPPSRQVKKQVLQKGGEMYYRDLDEMDSLMGTSRVEFVKAQHVEPFQVIEWLRNKQGILSQKADGTHVVFSGEKDNLYPHLPTIYDNTELDAEYVPSLKLNLIFQIRSNFHAHTNFMEDFLDLKNEHPEAKYIAWENYVFTESETYDSVKYKLDRDWQGIQTFILNNQNQTDDLWWPKPVYTFNFENPQKKMEILKMIQEYHRRLFILHGKEYQNDFLPTDGIILMENNNKKELWKLKPVYFMTADLLHQGNIIRCDWNRYENRWNIEEGEIRTDKQFPNPPVLVQKLETYHRHPWKLDDLQLFLRADFYYLENNKKDISSQEFISECHRITDNFLSHNILTKINKYHDSILDLGCGFGEKSLWKKNSLKIDGFDIEPKIWLHNKNKIRNQDIYYQDISQTWETPSNKILEYYNAMKYMKRWNSEEKKYKLVTSFMSWHNVLQNPEGENIILRELDKVTEKGTQLVISFLDRNILFQKEKELPLTSQSYLKLVGKNKLQYQYSWRHSIPQTENIMSREEITETLSKAGWQLDTIDSPTNRNILADTNPWNRVLDSFQILSFVRV